MTTPLILIYAMLYILDLMQLLGKRQFTMNIHSISSIKCGSLLPFLPVIKPWAPNGPLKLNARLMIVLTDRKLDWLPKATPNRLALIILKLSLLL